MAATALSSSMVPVATVPGTSSVATVRASSVSMAKAFGLKSSNMGRVTCMASYNVTLIFEDGKQATLPVSDETYILDEFEEKDFELPYSCRAGSCSSCAGKIESGTVDQTDGSYLDDDQLEAGYVLTCVAKPTSDVTIYTHKEEDLQ